jgi:glycosyltransferase involved in cell wall biosynthesis
MDGLDVKVSVIVPVYNAEKDLARCLDSLAVQTLDGIEVVAVNDGSTDGSREILEGYRETYPHIFTVIHTENRGVSAARNTALKAARGRYIGFTDSDDAVLPDMFEKLYTAQEAAGTQLSVCTRINVMPGGTHRVRLSKILRKKAVFPIGSEEERGLFLGGMSIFIWDKLFSADIIRRNALTFSPLHVYGEDFNFVAKYVAFVEKLVIVNEALYLYTTRSEGSVTNAISPKWYDIFSNIKDVVEFYQARGEYSILEPYLRQVAIRFYDRRVQSFSQYQNARFLGGYVRRTFHFLDVHFPGWRKSIFAVEKLSRPEVKSSFLRMQVCVHMSAERKREMTEELPTPEKRSGKIMSVFQNRRERKEKEVLKQGPAIYARCRKEDPIGEDSVFFHSKSTVGLGNRIFCMMKALSGESRFRLFLSCEDEMEAKRFLTFYLIEATLLVRRSLPFQKCLAAAKYVVTDGVLPRHFRKRKEQILIRLWHGDPDKPFGKDAPSPMQQLNFNQSQFLMADYLIFFNEAAKEKVLHCFSQEQIADKKVIVCGDLRPAIFSRDDTAPLCVYDSTENVRKVNERLFLRKDVGMERGFIHGE